MDEFPVDVVYTWVDGSDEAWLRKKDAALGNSSPCYRADDVSGTARFLDRDELKYSLRSVIKFAPWVRKIFIVTDNQAPKWLDTSSPKVDIVDHREIFPVTGALPCFSSRAIETRLHHIEGLADHFLYFNDDVFLGRATDRSDFFFEEGKPKLFVEAQRPLLRRRHLLDESCLIKDNMHQRAILNARIAVYKRFGKIVPYLPCHGIVSASRGFLEEVESLFDEEIKNTLRHPFRDKSDVLFSALVTYCGIAQDASRRFAMKPYRGDWKRYKVSLFRQRRDYVYALLDRSVPTMRSKLEAIRNYGPLMFCINDTPGASQENAELVDAFYREFLHESTTFEVSHAGPDGVRRGTCH